MELFPRLIDYFKITLENGSLGLSIYEILLILGSFLFAIFIRGYFAKIFISKIKKITFNTGNKIDDELFDSIADPLKAFPFILVFILIGFLFIDDNSKLASIYEKINRTFATIFIFWFLHQFMVPLSKIFQKIESLLSKALFVWLVQSLKYLFIFLGAVAVLETWGIKIGPIIAGLGLFGVAVALGAQDLFKNLIAGIMILLEKRFNIGDVISVPGHTEGTVEHIGFRSTLIRKFDSTPITIPNYIFAEAPILNFTDRKNRRINWIVGLEYKSTVNDIKKFTDLISDYISKSNNFIVNDNFKSFVRLDKFNDSSIDILIYCFTSTNEWENYLKIKEDLGIKIKEIAEDVGVNFAFPSSSIYIEKYKL